MFEDFSDPVSDQNSKEKEENAVQDMFGRVYHPDVVEALKVSLENEGISSKKLGDTAKTWAAAVLGIPADLIAGTVFIGNNLYNMAKGGTFTWIENFNEVPATSDWWANLMGLDTGSVDYIVGSILSPTGATSAAASAAKGAFFAGALARTAKNKKFKEFESLERLGFDEKILIQKTGLWRGRDGHIKFAVSDVDMKVSDLNEIMSPAQKTALKTAAIDSPSPMIFTLDQLITHDALFEAYPQLRGLKVILSTEKYVNQKTGEIRARAWASMESGDMAAFNPATSASEAFLEINSGYDMKRTIVHEVQHAIQQIEGFSFGSNTTPLKNALDIRIEAQAQIRIIRVIQKNPDVIEKEDILKMMESEEISSGIMFFNLTFMERVRKLAAEGEPQQLDKLMDFYKMSEDKSSNMLIAMLTELDPKNLDNVKDVLNRMNVFEIDHLITQRYLRQGGEVEARLVEALVDMKQEKLDKLLIPPEKLLDIIDGVADEISDIGLKVGVKRGDIIP